MNSYDELPFFRVEMINCDRKNNISYGIVPFCEKTGRSCMLRARESWAYIAFLRGVYHLCYVKDMVSSLTQTEYERICKCIDDFDYLRLEMKRISLQAPKKYLLKYTSQRLQDAKRLILSCPIPQQKKLAYTYSRGQLKKDEEPLDCAYREFQEESGVNLSHYRHTISDETLEKTYKTATDLPYTVVIYKAIFNEEFELPNQQNHEVQKVKWVL